MESCWADCLGNCDEKLSREHLVSEAFFLGDVVVVHGFSWCKDEPKVIGLSALTSKILCEKHNNELSPLDTAVGKSSETFREIDRLYAVRGKLKPHYWNVKRFAVDGALLERWLLKTLINLWCNKQHPIGRDSTVEGSPSDRLVRIAFGLEKFKGKAGLHFVVKEKMNIAVDERLQCTTLPKNNKIEMALFSFKGFGLLLCLEEEGPPDSLRGLSFGGQDLGDVKPLFREATVNFNMGKYRSHTLQFKW